VGSPENPGFLNWFLIFLLGIVWGASFICIKVSLQTFGPWTTAFVRVLIGGLALSVIGWLLGQGLNKIPNRKAWAFEFAIGIFNVAIPLTLLSWGQQYVSSAFAGVSMGAVPLMVVPLVFLFSSNEIIDLKRICGLIIGFMGLILLFDFNPSIQNFSKNQILGQLTCLLATACYAGGSILTRMAPPMPPISFATATLISAALVLFPIAMFIEGLPTTFSLESGSALLFLAIFSTATGAVIRVHVTTTAGPVFMSLTSYQVPVWAVIYSSIFTQEALPPKLLIALAVILIGIGLTEHRSLKKILKTYLT